MERKATQREIALFAALLVATSGIFYGLLLVDGNASARWLTSPLPGLFMWCPGVAALLTCAILRRSVRGLGWRWGGWRHYAVAYALPLVFGLPAYLALWASPWADFDPSPFDELAGRLGVAPTAAGVAASVLVVLALAPLGIFTTLGEELGWRGFLVPRLARLFDLRTASLIVGLVWALWHYPLVLLVVPRLLPDLPLALGTVCFTLMVVAISGVYTWQRLRSGSVFPAALLHATSNSFVFGLDRLTEHHTPYFSHEYGIAMAVAIPLVAWPFWRRLDRRVDRALLDSRQVS